MRDVSTANALLTYVSDADKARAALQAIRANIVILQGLRVSSAYTQSHAVIMDTMDRNMQRLAEIHLPNSTC
jgi:hypothetical protein